MSTQPPADNKNWLYFIFGSGAMLLLSIIAFSLFNFTKSQSAQSQSAGTWKIDANGLPSGTPPFTIIVSPEGKIFALDPRNEKESIEVGKITKLSDVATLPDSTKVQADPFANQARAAKQSEAKTYVGTLNKGQQTHYIQNGKWGQNIDALGIGGIKSETENYRYNTQVVSSIKTVNIKNYLGITIQTGVAKKEGLKSYLGVVYSGADTFPLAILCESNEPTTKEAGSPKFDGKAVQCPDDYKPLG